MIAVLGFLRIVLLLISGGVADSLGRNIWLPNALTGAPVASASAVDRTAAVFDGARA